MESNEFLQQIETYAKEFATKRGTGADLMGEITAFLDRYYIVYLESAAEQCDKIRASFYGNRAFENFLFGYTRRAASQLRLTGKENWLWMGLVSISLENCGIDYRDTLMGLAELYVNAERQGIDPRVSFANVADLSSKEKPRGGTVPMYVMMKEFEHSAILQERRKMVASYWEK